jgi:L,D-transpeptidase YcbB
MPRLLALLVLSLLLAGCGRDAPAGSDTPERHARTYTGPPETDVQAAIRQRLAPETGGEYDLPLSGARLDQARRAYESRDYRPIWTGSSEGLGRAEDLLLVVAQADRYALNPAKYDLAAVRDALERAYGEGDPEEHPGRLADADLHLSRLFLTFGRDLANGPFSPRSVGADWHVEDPDADLAGALRRVSDGDPVRILTGLASRHDGYRRLQEAFGRYRDYAEEGGFPEVPAGEDLRLGARGERVAALRDRLRAEGYETGSGDRLEGRLAEALALFQSTQGLPVDTVVAERTLRALNVSARERARQIQVNLVRWHWMPEDLGGRYLFVNLPEFRLHAYDDGKEVLSMPVVVGAEYDDRATPAFSDRVSYAEFRPYWNVPTDIAGEDMVPRGPTRLREGRFEIVRQFGAAEGDTLRMTEANLEAVAQGRAFLRERPSNNNGMGDVKYMFPNDFDIYLHDTPNTELFDERVRAFSYGCIRVEDPAALGAFLFAREGWDASEVRRRMEESPENHRVDLREPVPVFILYLTAFADEEGRVHFREDVYGYDAPIAEALAEQDLEPPVVDVDALVALLPD